MKVPVIVERVIVTKPAYMGEVEKHDIELCVLDLERVISIKARQDNSLIKFEDGECWLIAETIDEFVKRGFGNDSLLDGDGSDSHSLSSGDGERVSQPVPTQSFSIWNLFRRA